MKTRDSIATLLLLCLSGVSLPSHAATLDDFIGVRWGASIEDARKIVLSDRQRVLEKQENGVLASLSLRKGSYLGRPAAWWYLSFVNGKFSHGFVDFQLYRNQHPLYQFRKLRRELVSKYGEPLVDVDSHPGSDPSWEECAAVKPAFQCDWKCATSGENPETATVRLFMHGSTMEAACMRLVFGNDALSAERNRIERDLKSGVIAPGLAATLEETQARETAVKEAFEKLHSAIKVGNGKLALEMHSKESLRQMTEEQKSSWRCLRPNRNDAPNVSSVSLRSRTAGVHYTSKDSLGGLTYCCDLFVPEDGQWRLRSTHSQNRLPSDLTRCLWLPPDTAPFIESGEDWSGIEVVPSNDPSWSVQATRDAVFLYIRFIHATDLPIPGSALTDDPHPSDMIYTPGVSIGTANIHESIRLSVGEVIGTRAAKPKNQSFASYSLTLRRKTEESCSVSVGSSDGVLRVLGRWIDIRIPCEVLTNIPVNPLRIWVTPKAPASTFEYTVKEWRHRASPLRRVPPTTASLPVRRTPPVSDAVLDAAKQTLRTLANRIADGDEKGFNELLDTAKKLYRDIDFTRKQDRLSTNLSLMRAAYDILGEQAGKGNAKALEALKRSLRVRPLSSFAPDALGIAAAYGHAEALDILLHHDKHDILKSSAVFALQRAAEKNNAKAIAFLIAVLENPADRSLWYGASQGLMAVRDNPEVKAALEKHEAANRKPAEPLR